MAGSGPAPNPQSRRQSGAQAHTWIELPAEGFAGPIPEWPLVTNEASTAHLLNDPPKANKKIPLYTDASRLDGREKHHWAKVWRLPQAAAWAINGSGYDVALYVRCLVKGEFGDLDSVKEARMWSDRLGLNPAAMLKNRWRVRGDEVAEQRESATKVRLKVVAADAVAPA